MEAAAAHLLDFSKPFDAELLDQISVISQDSSHPQRARANDFLVMMKSNTEMWKRADAILETSKQDSSKFFALQVLSEMISTRWKIIPQDHRLGIRNYIVTKIMSVSTSDELMKKNHQILNRLNMVLVDILKQDWPHAWPSFIGDIILSSKSSESLCENNMQILKLLSEEVFDFSDESMTSAKIKHLKESLNQEFAQVFQLCEFILSGVSQKQSLLLATLQTLQRFLTWIPLGYIFETQLVSVLIGKFFVQEPFR
jgi:exportin-1